MDPNEVLAWLRRQLNRPDTDLDDVLERFAALDEWLNRGGFLPDAWQR